MRNKITIQREARNILAEFTERYPILGSVPIRISARMTRSAGTARFKFGKPFEIVLSLPFFADEANGLRSTVTHEAAHIIAGYAAGHGIEWKLIHRSMGGNAQRCHTMMLAHTFQRHQVEAICPKCDKPVMLGPVQAKKALRGIRYSHGRCPR